MTHKTVREKFVDALYGEMSLSDNQIFEEHLHGCPSCAAEFEQLKRVAGTMNLREREDLSPEDWKAFWNVLAASIEAQKEVPAPERRRVMSFLERFSPAVRLGAAAALILIIGIAIGRFGLVPDAGMDQSDAHRGVTYAEKVALREETMGYLERSKILLLGIVNSEGIMPEPDQIDRQQEVSRVLVTEGGPLKERLSRSGQQQLGELVDDLEILLMQIANLEIENDFPGLEIIRSGVDRKGILLKINVEQMKAQKQRSAPPAVGDATRSRSMI